MVTNPVQSLGAQVEILKDNVGTPGSVVIPLGNERIERIFASVPAGSMTAVVPESHRLRQGHVDIDAACDRCRNLGHLESVREASALVVGGKDHDLRFAGQAPESCGMHNPIAVTFETGALLVGLLDNRSVSRTVGKCCT